MDPFSAAAALGAALKAAMDITDGLLKSGGGAEFNTRVLELQRIILTTQRDALATQEAQFALLQEKRALEAKIAAMETWNSEKARYELKAIREDGKGPLAYSLKPDAQGTEPAHSICPQCYQHGEKSILQPQILQPGLAKVLACQGCGNLLYMHGQPSPEHLKYRGSGRR